ncbi:MAG: DNA polymerase I [Balneolaceae bacterium]|nr:DNA polymerase I [Balneolaceae bacterium]
MSRAVVYLLDGMALAYRAHFAFINANLRNSEGIPTGPIMGFANTVERLMNDHSPSHLAVAWDTHAPTFRHEMDAEYKANRPPQPEELRVGIPLIKEMMAAWGVHNLELDGYEADDILGTLASKAEAADADVYLVTPDKDYMQLVRDHIWMIKPDNANGGFVTIDRQGVHDYFGVEPEKVIDVLALIGDTSDNIPGVPGIGKKGAPALINEYGSLDALLEQAEHVKAKRAREGLLANAEQAKLAQEMVTIHLDVPGIPSWKELSYNGVTDQDALAQFFERMNFRTLSAKYGADTEPGGEAGGQAGTQTSAQSNLFDTASRSYTLIDSLERLDELVGELSSAKELCYDTETSSADPMQAMLVGISLSAKPGEAFYIPVNVAEGLSWEDVRGRVHPLFEDPDRLWIAQNAKFDDTILRRAGIQRKGRIFDTMIAAYVLDSSQKLSMDALAQTYLGVSTISIETLIGTGKSQKSMADLSPSEITDYACEDADITFQLYMELSKALQSEGLTSVVDELDFPLIEVLGRMEEHGVQVDMEMLSTFAKELESDLSRLENEIYTLAGREFSIQSPKQLGEVLFTDLGLPVGKKTKTGKVSTSEEVLVGLASVHDLPAKVLEYRATAKLKSTYVDALPELQHPETGRIHTSYNQVVAATGRLSSSSPNLQNIPIRTERGREIRKAFTAAPGYQLLAADYSQVELRVIASIAQDQAMIDAFQKGEDIHARTAREIFDLGPDDEVTGDQRRKAKEVNFGIPYGVSAYGLASRLGISNGEGKEMIDTYFERFPGIKAYMEETIAKAKEHRFVTTLSGRKRWIPDIDAKNFARRGFAERTAINMPIQGTAADIIKHAMIQIQAMAEREQWTSRMLLQVHDELVFEIHESEMATVPPKIQEAMESAMELSVPLAVEMGIADTWLEAH